MSLSINFTYQDAIETIAEWALDNAMVTVYCQQNKTFVERIKHLYIISQTFSLNQSLTSIPISDLVKLIKDGEEYTYSPVPTLKKLCLQVLAKIDDSSASSDLQDLKKEIQKEKSLKKYLTLSLSRPSNPHKDNPTYFKKIAKWITKGLPLSCIAPNDMVGTCYTMGSQNINNPEMALRCYRIMKEYSNRFIPDLIYEDLYSLKLISNGHLWADPAFISEQVHKFHGLNPFNIYVSNDIEEESTKVLSVFSSNQSQKQETVLSYDDFFADLTTKIERQALKLEKIPSEYIAPILSRLAHNAIDRNEQKKALIYYNKLQSLKFSYNNFENYQVAVKLGLKQWKLLDEHDFEGISCHPMKFIPTCGHTKIIGSDEKFCLLESLEKYKHIPSIRTRLEKSSNIEFMKEYRASHEKRN